MLTFPLSVTEIPSGWPSLILKVAREALARVLIGLCPVISARSLIAASKPFAFCAASPIPQFTTIFSILGTWNEGKDKTQHCKNWRQTKWSCPHFFFNTIWHQNLWYVWKIGKKTRITTHRNNNSKFSSLPFSLQLKFQLLSPP